jgi:hypothetical protein
MADIAVGYGYQEDVVSECGPLRRGAPDFDFTIIGMSAESDNAKLAVLLRGGQLLAFQRPRACRRDDKKTNRGKSNESAHGHPHLVRAHVNIHD